MIVPVDSLPKIGMLRRLVNRFKVCYQAALFGAADGPHADQSESTAGTATRQTIARSSRPKAASQLSYFDKSREAMK